MIDIIPKNESRVGLFGTTGSGKTTLLTVLLKSIRIQNPDSIHLIIDSKPRFRANFAINGKRLRYKTMKYGEFAKGSVLVNNPEDIQLAIKRGYKTLIAQVLDDEPNTIRLSKIGMEFYKTSSGEEQRWIWVDEVLDFFTPSGTELKNAPPFIVRAARAGRERSCNLVIGAQRLKGIPMVVIESLTHIFLFQIDYVEELERLRSLGIHEMQPPKNYYEFKFWQRKHRNDSRLFKLRI